MEIYQHEGAERTVRLILPGGHYAPSFVLQDPADRRPLSPLPEERSRSIDTAPDPIPAMVDRANLPRRAFWTSVPISAFLCLMAIFLTAAAIAVWSWAHAAKRMRPVDAPIVASGLPLPLPQATIHALMGKGRAAYVDHSGVTWTNGNYCRSGTSVSLPSQRIEGTEDIPLYLGGVRGIVHCAFPVPQGVYELHLHFSDTSYPDLSDLQLSTRDASITINSGTSQDLKVVDEAGGHNIALSLISTGVARENDGSIHLDYVSEVALLNAVEILPAPQSAKQLPIRIVASSRAFTDDAKQVWDSDRYFNGGRHGQEFRVANLSSLGIYQSSRVGRFRYNIPAVPLARYRVKLYFRDPWFGKDNGGAGGPGSRVFDVACNGVLLLKNFDILAEGESKPVVKTFENVQASAAGRLELFFMPVVNYPTVSAIEIVPED
jgi:hypothetical protein